MSHSLSSTLACTLAMRSYEWQNIKYMSNTVLSFTLCIYTFNSRNVCVSWVGIMRHKIFVDTHQYCLKIILKHYLFQYIMDIYLCSVFIYCINTDTDYWWPILTNISSAENCTLAKSVSSLLSQASSQVQSWENTHQRSVWHHIS